MLEYKRRIANANTTVGMVRGMNENTERERDNQPARRTTVQEITEANNMLTVAAAIPTVKVFLSANKIS